MANPKTQINVLVVGDSSGAQKALKEVAAAANSAAAETNTAADKIAGAGEKIGGGSPKVESFGKAFRATFLELGAAAAVGAKAADAVIETVKNLGEAVGEYNAKMQESSATILAVTKDHGKLADALAFADQQAKAGRSAYSDTVAAIAELTPTAKRANIDVLDLYHTVQLLSALNSGPDGGVAGAVIAINNALTGQWTSLQDRFNLSTTGIQKAVAAGIPPLVAINDALAKEGVTMDLVNAKSQTLANQTAILKDNFVRLAAEKTQDFFITVNSAVRDLNGEITNQSSVLHALINDFQDLQDTLGQVGKGGFGEAVRGLDKSSAEFERSVLQWVRDLPNTRGPNDPITAWINQQIDNYTKAIDAGKPYVEVKNKELADAAAKAAQATPAAAVAGFAPTPAQLAEAQQHGAETLNAYIKGLSTDQIGAVQSISGVFADLFKADTTGKAAQAQTVLAQALQQVARDGQITSDTMLDLSASFGTQTPEVVRLVTAYNSMAVAQGRAKLAADELTAAQQRQQQVQYRAKGDLDTYQRAINDAQQAAAQHAQDAADAVAPLQQRLKDAQQAAADTARAGAAELQSLQDDLAGFQREAQARQDAYAAQIADAQARAQAQTTRRTELQGLLTAALKGTTEEYLRQNDITDESIRKIGEKWQAEIDGQRRAKEGANQQVTNLSRAANKEDLDYIQRIQAARAAGDTRQAAAIQKEWDKRKQARQGEMDLARAQAAVANDEYDAKAEQLQKQGDAQDEQEAKAEKAANAEVTRIQHAAAEQKKADDAEARARQQHIADVQRQQQAEQQRSQDAQRGIQGEIDKINDQATAQKRRDDAAVIAAQQRYTERKTYWDQEEAGANVAVGLFGALAGNQKAIADDSKTAYDNLTNISKINFQNLQDAAQATKDIKDNTPKGLPILNTGGTQGDDNGQNTTPPNYGGTQGDDNGQGGSSSIPTNYPLLPGQPGQQAPAGYHTEVDTGGNFWYVPDGATLYDYGKTPNSTRRAAGSDSNSLGRGTQAAAKLTGLGGASTGGTPTAGDVHLHINAPNLTNLGDRQQQAAFAQQAHSALKAAIASGPSGRVA